MAASDGVWGIDVGQCALKALRLRPHESPRRVMADAFDYVEYPKILSQPGSDPAELIGDALKQFLSRNSIKGDRVAISVSGQAGLARFIKLPPVEAKKIPDIVRYEARQQIPFDLNDVIWDYQRMGGGAEEEGFAMETEIGLFAMKRDAVFRSLGPFLKAGIEVDFVQLTPLAIYNLIVFDQIKQLPSLAEYDPEKPPESIVVVSIGTDSTDLVVTDGIRVWQRSVPVGGSHFTKALTKELKLTFAKAEHLKRNASSAQDPKAVFQAMRPVFNDLLTELQRSIGYFTSLNRNAKIGRVLAIGNTMKLPGLRRYLSQNLGLDIKRLDQFRRMLGPQVLAAPAFKDNILSFSVSYGLALQGLGKAGLRTNLLPREIVKDRMVRHKKPWAVAAVAQVMLACTVAFALSALSLGTVSPDRTVNGVSWADAEKQADSIKQQSGQLKQKADEAVAQLKQIADVGTNLTANVEGRLKWLELMRLLNDCLPRDSGARPADVEQRRELHIHSLTCEEIDDVAKWYEAVKKYRPEPPPPAVAGGDAAPGGPPPDAAAQNPPPADATGAGAGVAATDTPSGRGWIIQLIGYHYHNKQEFGPSQIGADYVRSEFFTNLETKPLKLPQSDGSTVELTAKQYGLDCPVLINPPPLREDTIVDPNPLPGDVARAGEVLASGNRSIKVKRFDFHIQMCWRWIPPDKRVQPKEAATVAENKNRSGEAAP